MALEKLDLSNRDFTAGRQPAEQLRRGLNKTSTAVTAEQLTTVSIDRLLADCSDLINPTFREWYCKAFYKLGIDLTHALAKQARGGKSPARYFSFLVRHALSQ